MVGKNGFAHKGAAASIAAVLAFGTVPMVPMAAFGDEAGEVVGLEAPSVGAAELIGALPGEAEGESGAEFLTKPDGLEGEGTAESPYQADSVEDLEYAFEQGGHVMLTGNIEKGVLEPSGNDVGAVATVANGVEVSLNLNGYTISAELKTNGNNYARAHVILNNGTLTIDDSSENHTGSIVNANAGSNACTRTIKNNEGATLTVNGGTVSGTVALLNLGECAIDGESVEIKSEAKFGPGGWDNSSAAIEHRGAAVTRIGKAVVSSESRAAFFCDGSGFFYIEGGQFTGNTAYGAVNGSTADSMAKITGGLFSSDPTDLIDQSAYVAASGSTGYFEVVKLGEVSSATVASGEDLLAKLGAASYEAPLNITLEGDVTLDRSAELLSGSTLTIPEGSSLTVAEGAVLSASGLVCNSGTLTVDGFMTNPLNLTGTGAIAGVDLEAENYEIKTAMDLQWLTYLVEYGEVRHVSLSSDIVLPSGVEFQMIGSGNKGFYGLSDFDRNTFDGRGHSITGLKFGSTSSDAGLFTSLMYADVKNLTADVDAEANTAYIGGITGYAVEGVTFQGVTVKGSVKVTGGSYGCAAIAASVGYNGSSSAGNVPVYFIDCRSEASVGGSYGYNIGSMFGTASGSGDDVYVYNCSNSGAVTAAGSVGYVFGYGYLNNAASLEIIGFCNEGMVNGAGGSISNAVGGGYTYEVEHADGSQYMAAKKDDGTWIGVSVSDVVAVVDGSAYTDFASAVAAMEDGSAAKVLKEVSLAGAFVISKDVTLTGLGKITLGEGGSLAVSAGTYDADPINYVKNNYVVRIDAVDAFSVLPKFGLTEGEYRTVEGEGVTPSDLAPGYSVEKNEAGNWEVYVTPQNPPAGGGDTTTPPAPSEPEGDVVENPDGSTTTTVTEETKNPDGSTTTTVTETTEGREDGSVTEKVTETTVGEDGAENIKITETNTLKDGTAATVVTENGVVSSVEASVSQAAVDAAAGSAVKLPMESVEAVSSDKAPEISVSAPEGTKVSVPVKADPATGSAPVGAVIVLVGEDGAETVLPKTVNDGDALSAELPEGAVIKVVNAATDFPDVSQDDWFAEDGTADFVSARGIMTGVTTESGVQFQGDESTSRGMFVTMLHRMEMEPVSEGSEGFEDVVDDSWYAESSAWAVGEGIATGYECTDGAAVFDGDGVVTREQVATFLFRYAQWLGIDTSVRADGPVEGVSDYAADAMSWAVAEGIFRGDGGMGNIRPGDGATRAEAAVVIMRMIALMA